MKKKKIKEWNYVLCNMCKKGCGVQRRNYIYVHKDIHRISLEGPPRTLFASRK